jgi:predicted DNA-binding transcriptional regulator AlpA
MMSTLWGVRECAHYLRRSASWVYHATSRGDLPYRRIGGRLAFEPEVIRAWVQRQPGTDLAATLQPRHPETSRILEGRTGSPLTSPKSDNSMASLLSALPERKE